LPLAKISKVVVAEFAQVLPRRRLRVTREGDDLAVSLHGPAPNAGPMQFPGDSPFQNVSFVNPPFETGRNRVELVLQEQEAGIDSDLGWRDVRVLAESVVGDGDAGTGGGPGGVVVPPPIRPDVFVDTGTSGRRTVARRAGGSVVLPALVERRPLIVPGPFLRDPSFWSADVTLPTASAKQRLLIREFERYYSDNTVTQRMGVLGYPRRIIEERLVFADVVDLAKLS
jgi:hypothetical protein